MDLCVFNFNFIFIFYSDRLGSNESNYRFDFLKYDFYYFYGHANFCIWTLYFQYPSTFGNFLHHASLLKWVSNLSTNINVNFHIPGDGLISYNSLLNQIFIPWTCRKKTSLLFSNVTISQMTKTEKFKF
jgi:hypothetical protein